MSINSYQNSVDRTATEGLRQLNAVNPRRAFVITFGCQQNESDSERIRGILADTGFLLADSYAGADVVILNTCAIRAHAEDKVLSLLGNIRAANKDSEGIVIGVCGCMAAEPTAVDRLKNKFPYVSFTLEPNSPERLPFLLYRAIAERKRAFVLGVDRGDITEDVPTLRASSFRAWVPVMYGCNNFCSYCIVPYVRGRERSRGSADVISECRELVTAGTKEITLLGQNVNSYRSDMDFAELLDRIADIDGDFTIRFMTSHPKDVSDALISVMARHSDKIAPYFHLPLQSGSDKILRLMNRTYDSKKFIETARRLRYAIPDITLSTDVIVGFPGEEDEDFRDTLSVLREVGFDAVYGFVYSEREGTCAIRFDGKVDRAVASSRLSELFAQQDPISTEKNQRFVNTRQRVLVYSVSSDGIASATAFSGKLVRFAAKEVRPGDLVEVIITAANPYELSAEFIKK